MKYRKTIYTSPQGFFIAKELLDGGYHIYRKGGDSILYGYDSERNRFTPHNNIVELSPEALSDIADFGKGLYEKDND